jgi:hypothetical protein
MTPKSLHDHHTVRVAWRVRRSTHDISGDAHVRPGTALEMTALRIADQTLENWMKLVKTSAIAVAVSALLIGPVLAQGAASDTQVRGGARTNMQGGAAGSADGDVNAGAAGQKAGADAKTGMKGTVGAGSGAPKGSGGAAGGPVTGR